MPYFVFKLGADQSLELMQTYEKFKEAKQYCREQRAQAANENSEELYRLMFAKNDGEAKRLIREKHKPSSPLEEWEA